MVSFGCFKRTARIINALNRDGLRNQHDTGRAHVDVLGHVCEDHVHIELDHGVNVALAKLIRQFICGVDKTRRAVDVCPAFVATRVVLRPPPWQQARGVGKAENTR